MKTNILLLIMISIVSLLSCTQEELNNVEIIHPKTIENSLETGELFAKELATSLNNKELLSFIMNTANEKFDGDNNFLIIPNLDKQPNTKSSTNKTFRELLKTNKNHTKSTEYVQIDSLLKQIEIHNPLQQIYVMNEEIWDTTTQKPLVIYLPNNFDEKNTLWVKAYDFDGNSYQVNAQDDFDNQPIIVISQNERTVSVSKEKALDDNTYYGATPIYQNEYYNYYLIEDIEFPIISKSEATPLQYSNAIRSTTKSDCYRSTYPNQKDYINRVRITTKNAWKSIEAALKGDPELYVNVVYGAKSKGNRYITSMYKYVGTGYGRRRKIKWATKNIDIIKWSRQDNGESMKYIWYEKDGRDDSGITVNFSIDFLGYPTLTGNAEIHIWRNDDKAGESIIYYTDENNTYYNTGIVHYNIQVK